MDVASIFRAIFSSPLALLIAVLFFCASIFVHELGHFLAARWRGLKVDRFSIGFGPRLFGWKDKHGVDWRISALPLGGYVSLPQLADMRGIEGNPDGDVEPLPNLTWFDKIAVLTAGAIFNVLFALFLGTILWFTGVPSAPSLATTELGYVAEEVYPDPQSDNAVPGPAFEAGLRPGDRIIAVDGKEVSDFDDLRIAIVAGTGQSEDGGPAARLTVEREGETFEVVTHPVRAGLERARALGVRPAEPLIVGGVFPDSPASKAGLQAQDKIIAANGEPILSTLRVSEIVSESAGNPIAFTIEREGAELTVSVTPEAATITTGGDQRIMIGVSWAQNFVNVHKDPFTQIAEVFEMTIVTIKALLTPSSDVGLRAMNGPIGILSVLQFTAQQDILFVLWMVVLINVNLAVINLLPLPVLDGGHIVFATIQKLTGKPVPANIIQSLQGAMMLALLGMVIYVSFFDLVRLRDDGRAQAEAEAAAEQRITPVFQAEESSAETSAEPAP
jgi:regulator of sigma E protease